MLNDLLVVELIMQADAGAEILESRYNTLVLAIKEKRVCTYSVSDAFQGSP